MRVRRRVGDRHRRQWERARREPEHRAVCFARLEHGGEACRLESDAAHVEHQRARLQARDPEIAAVAGNRVDAVGMEQRDLRAEQANAGAVGDAADQYRGSEWDRVLVKRVAGLLRAHDARRTTSGDELPHHNHSELRHGALTLCRVPESGKIRASGVGSARVPIPRYLRPRLLVTGCWLLATANGATPTSSR